MGLHTNFELKLSGMQTYVPKATHIISRSFVRNNELFRLIL